MTFHIHFNDFWELHAHLEASFEDFTTWVDDVEKELILVAESDAIQGEAAKAIRDYIEQVHLVLINGLETVLDEFSRAWGGYLHGWQSIDFDPYAKIIETDLEDLEARLESHMTKFDTLHDEIDTQLRRADSVYRVGTPDPGQVENASTDALTYIDDLIETVGTYEREQQNITESTRELLTSLQTTIDNHLANTSVTTGLTAVRLLPHADFPLISHPGTRELQDSIAAHTPHSNEHVITSLDDGKARFDFYTQVELRDSKGTKQIIAGVVTILLAGAGAAVTISTAGAGLPLLLLGGAAIGIAASDIGEGRDLRSLADQKDIVTEPLNIGRDYLLAGNQDIWNATSMGTSVITLAGASKSLGAVAANLTPIGLQISVLTAHELPQDEREKIQTQFENLPTKPTGYEEDMADLSSTTP